MSTNTNKFETPSSLGDENYLAVSTFGHVGAFVVDKVTGFTQLPSMIWKNDLKGLGSYMTNLHYDREHKNLIIVTRHKIISLGAESGNKSCKYKFVKVKQNGQQNQKICKECLLPKLFGAKYIPVVFMSQRMDISFVSVPKMGRKFGQNPPKAPPNALTVFLKL